MFDMKAVSKIATEPFMTKTKLKTEEGYGADNVGTMSAQHLTKDLCLMRELLCGHFADILRT